MNPSDLSDLVMAVSIIFTIAFSTVFAYGAVRVVNVWSFRAKAKIHPQNVGYDSAAIERLQASVDAISIEVERISEGQRFTTKLMNERIPDPVRIAPGQERASGISQ